MTTMYPEIRLDTEDSVPLCLDFYYDADNADNDECMLLYGTDSGTVHIFNIRTSALFNNTSGKKEHTRHISMDTIPRGANMTTLSAATSMYGTTPGGNMASRPPTTILGGKVGAANGFTGVNINSVGGAASPQYGTLTKRKAHNDWCVKVAFFVDLHMVISCSPDPRASLFVATQVTKKKWACFSVPVHKGVSAFAYCKFPVTLITGGTDRQLRLWNPYRMHHPMAALKGHNAPIVDIAINNFSGQIISLSSDKVIKVWDIRKQQCVQTLCDNFPHHPEDALSCLTFCPNTNSYSKDRGPGDERDGRTGNDISRVGKGGGGRLVAASSLLVTYKLRERNVRVSIPVSHEMPLRAALYNASFKQVVSGCDGSVINVWDVVNGQKSFRFADVHGKAEITAMSFDAGSRRLITGGRDGLIRMWNFNNGQCLHEMIKGDDTEVSGICYIDLKGSQFVVASGWNRRITMFQDSLESFKLYPIQRWPDPEIIGNAANPSPPFPSTEPPQWEEITAPPPSSWHSDDILAMDFCPPNMLITSSYDGEILVCNLVSGHVLHRLCPRDFGDDSIGLNDVTSRSIDKVIVLSERIDLLKEAALLITSGADGYIRWWNLDEGYLMHMHGTPPRFSPSESKGVYAMATNARNTMLVTGDAVGFVTILDIKEHCISQNIRPSSPPPPVIAVFRAHVATIMSVDIVEGYDMVISASTDGTARMFTFKGEYVGTFGQDEPWDIGDPSTFEHPLKPLDVALHEVEESQDPDAIEEFKKVMERRYTRRHAPSGSQRRKNCGSMDFGIDTIPSGEESCVKGSRFGSGRRGEGALPIDAIHDSPWTSAQELLSPAQAGRPVSKGATRLVSMLEPPMATGAGLPRINAAGGGLTTGGVLEKPIAVDRNGIKPRAPSWYTKSLYVQERQHLQPRKIKKRTPMPVISTTRGAYHALQPRELSEFVEIRVPPFLSHGRKATMTESGLNPLPH